jgi:zinc-binding alcohol dehydrogenase/oxidoreductase
MFAWYLNHSPGEYEWGEVEPPPLEPTAVAVRVLASGLNQIDNWLTRGTPKPKTFPHVPGSDGAGVVAAIGSEVTGWKVGDEVVLNPALVSPEALIELGEDSVLDPSLRILGEHTWGCHGEFVNIAQHQLTRKPPELPWEECATYPVAATTAWRMILRGRVQPGERVLITGVGGGVSAFAQLLCQHIGAEVFTTSRDEAKRQTSKRLGAADSFPSEAAFPVTVDVVLDSIGPAVWQNCFTSLRRGGRFVTCGATSGQTIELHIPSLFFKQHEIIGSTLGSQAEFEQVTQILAQGLPSTIDRVVPLSEYPLALERLREGSQFGTIVLDHGKN